eukprot:10861696-Lingulodinium_polyedra.AAC.1
MARPRGNGARGHPRSCKPSLQTHGGFAATARTYNRKSWIESLSERTGILQLRQWLYKSA